jgi:hypothetical protein
MAAASPGKYAAQKLKKIHLINCTQLYFSKTKQAKWKKIKFLMKSVKLVRPYITSARSVRPTSLFRT